ncbi:hypothetical protein AB0399_20840 [Streptomyces sp. NPDC088194]|uniref:hypothetical protein n=1 Tax=Streptomyces sp. NPDC088194 TaxID=3154931 RepID=UPI00344D401D
MAGTAERTRSIWKRGPVLAGLALLLGDLNSTMDGRAFAGSDHRPVAAGISWWSRRVQRVR